MTPRDGGSGNPPIEVGRGDGGVDVIESGPEGVARLPGRIAAGWVLVLVVVAGVTGYWVGGRHRAGAAAPAVTASVAAAVEPPIVGTGKRCSGQLKDRLQLGVEVVNRSAATVSLRQLQAILPLQGLRPAAATWGSCGQLPAAGSGGNYLLAAGGTTWLTMTFDVLVACPAPLPVLFTVEFAQGGRSDDVDLPGFPDLGDVPYSGAKC
ncbi:hypothetical protein [Actinoplanes sp. NPDC051411]|uniref:hypothetical protein n=1 Tax=Actinoplanes sp. NPDC051411 TaxID=3155522 RepID=UPI00341F92BE